jgi:hypothetical protein
MRHWLEECSGVIDGSLKVPRDPTVLFVTVLEDGNGPLQYLQHIPY